VVADDSCLYKQTSIQNRSLTVMGQWLPSTNSALCIHQINCQLCLCRVSAA